MFSKAYIETGILEQFVCGQLSKEKETEVLQMVQQYADVKEELRRIEERMERYVISHHETAPADLKEQVLAAIKSYRKYIPEITAVSQIQDYDYWINRPQNKASKDFKNFHYKVIGQQGAQTFLILWYREGMDKHMHKDMIEIALILEGNCEMTIDGVTTSHSPGEVIFMPKFCEHALKVTSATPLKAILMQEAC